MNFLRPRAASSSCDESLRVLTKAQDPNSFRHYDRTIRTGHHACTWWQSRQKRCRVRTRCSQGILNRHPPRENCSCLEIFSCRRSGRTGWSTRRTPSSGPPCGTREGTLVSWGRQGLSWHPGEAHSD